MTKEVRGVWWMEKPLELELELELELARELQLVVNGVPQRCPNWWASRLHL